MRRVAKDRPRAVVTPDVLQRLARLVLVAALGLLLAPAARAVERTWIYAVLLEASVATAPARIELAWQPDPFPVQRYTVQRKALADAAWGEPVELGGDATRFSDENVEPGRTYEYQVIKHAAAHTGYGYIAVGLHAPLADAPGRVILIVDDTIAAPLAAELERLQSDLTGDGWNVSRHEVSRAARPADVRAVIRREYEADRERTRAVLLVGRVPVVWSGRLNVDGHGARPMPADVFYGDVDGEWTDANGDGIFDQDLIPSPVELQVGRIDFADLPGRQAATPFPGEIALLKRYLDKDHAYRHALVRPQARALVGNVIGDASGQATAASGYRNFAALLGASNITTADSEPQARTEDRWISLLTKNDYLWVYGCGGGGDSSMGGLGLHGPYFDAWSSDFVEQKAKGTFYLAFGSWFGDWSKTDNLLRAMLAAPDHGLTAAWSGRPHLYFHSMGVGETIGHGIRLSQNNRDLYRNQVQRQAGGIHVALLGDPTLRMHVIAPPGEARAGSLEGDVQLTWRASPDRVSGYHVYRAARAAGPFTRLTNEPVTETRFTDIGRAGASATYLVRAVALISSPSGVFHHASQGVFVTYEGGAASARPGDGGWTDATRPADIVWFDDALPEGAAGHAERDAWTWVAGNPPPFSGGVAHQAEIAPGRHHHFFAGATQPLAVAEGDTLVAYVYLDPANPPRQVMLTWLAGHWEHRAYWGENLIDEGVNGTASRRHLGPLPPSGRWVRLEVPAHLVDMEGRAATGMGFTLFDGRATWDRAGKSRP